MEYLHQKYFVYIEPQKYCLKYGGKDRLICLHIKEIYDFFFYYREEHNYKDIIYFIGIFLTVFLVTIYAFITERHFQKSKFKRLQTAQNICQEYKKLQSLENCLNVTRERADKILQICFERKAEHLRAKEAYEAKCILIWRLKSLGKGITRLLRILPTRKIGEICKIHKPKCKGSMKDRLRRKRNLQGFKLLQYLWGKSTICRSILPKLRRLQKKLQREAEAKAKLKKKRRNPAFYNHLYTVKTKQKDAEITGMPKETRKSPLYKFIKYRSNNFIGSAASRIHAKPQNDNLRTTGRCKTLTEMEFMLKDNVENTKTQSEITDKSFVNSILNIIPANTKVEMPTTENPRKVHISLPNRNIKRMNYSTVPTALENPSTPKAKLQISLPNTNIKTTDPNPAEDPSTSGTKVQISPANTKIKINSAKIKRNPVVHSTTKLLNEQKATRTIENNGKLGKPTMKRFNKINKSTKLIRKSDYNSIYQPKNKRCAEDIDEKIANIVSWRPHEEFTEIFQRVQHEIKTKSEKFNAEEWPTVMEQLYTQLKDTQSTLNVLNQLRNLQHEDTDTLADNVIEKTADVKIAEFRDATSSEQLKLWRNIEERRIELENVEFSKQNTDSNENISTIATTANELINFTIEDSIFDDPTTSDGDTYGNEEETRLVEHFKTPSNDNRALNCEEDFEKTENTIEESSEHRIIPTYIEVNETSSNSKLVDNYVKVMSDITTFNHQTAEQETSLILLNDGDMMVTTKFKIPKKTFGKKLKKLKKPPTFKIRNRMLINKSIVDTIKRHSPREIIAEIPKSILKKIQTCDMRDDKRVRFISEEEILYRTKNVHDLSNATISCEEISKDKT